MMWEECARKTQALGGNIEMGCKVVGAEYDDATSTWTLRYKDEAGNVHTLESEHVISSAPMRELVNGIKPSVSDAAKHAANSLKYRDFLTVMLILKNRDAFADNWIYIHDPKVKVGRIQNFRSWSPEMVPDPELACVGLEYFCFEGDGLWASSDEDLVALATRELATLGLADPKAVVGGRVVRQEKAYPVYDDAYRANVEEMRAELEEAYPTLHMVGRNGMHRYNNQDHAMMTAMLTVRNIEAGARVYDIWAVNEDAEYHESGEEGQIAAERQAALASERLVPSRLKAA
jgi:protoporphyrinogen oxidase